VGRFLDRLAPTLAFLASPLTDQLEWNTQWGQLAEGIGLVPGSPNLAVQS
jgi:hypothetical protein